ncbi:MAG: hypothetical protein WB037_21790, partial [Pseudolabrys sp.]
MSLFAGNSKRSFVSALTHSVAGAGLLFFIGGVSTSVDAQDGAYDPANYAWQAGAIRHAQKMRAFFDSDRGQQTTP